LGYTEEELRTELKNENSHASLLYKHLKRSRGESPVGSVNKNFNMSAGIN
jgi:hypothetical protein